MRPQNFREALSCRALVGLSRTRPPCAMMPMCLLVMVSRPPTRDDLCCLCCPLPLESARVGGLSLLASLCFWLVNEFPIPILAVLLLAPRGVISCAAVRGMGSHSRPFMRPQNFREALSCRALVGLSRTRPPCAMMPMCLLVMVSRPPTRDDLCCLCCPLPLESARVGGLSLLASLCFWLVNEFPIPILAVLPIVDARMTY